ncbi:MAG: 30S ribosomal protein S16 [Oligoflexia bacterium]|nr:30S ribosomal protein S16 [Oligoflexia bacterium]
MVVIRLSRSGRRNLPLFRFTVADKRRFRDGKFLARIGWYNPCENDMKKRMNLDLSALDAWVKKGAQPSETVAELVRQYRAANG